jgi:hypothetical protein
MNEEKEVDGLAATDLTDLIADELSPEVCAKYYRELNHCKSLPQDDEMLRILRIMQILTLLMVQVPGNVAIERQKLEQLLAFALKKIQESHQASQAWQKQIDERLARLPSKILEGLDPAAIVDRINFSLKQEFLLSTIPQTGEALRLVGQQMKTAADDFVNTSKGLTHSYFGIAENAKNAIESMDGAITRAAAAAKKAAQDLSDTFFMKYEWAIFAISGLALYWVFTLECSSNFRNSSCRSQISNRCVCVSTHSLKGAIEPCHAHDSRYV